MDLGLSNFVLTTQFAAPEIIECVLFEYEHSIKQGKDNYNSVPTMPHLLFIFISHLMVTTSTQG